TATWPRSSTGSSARSWSASKPNALQSRAVHELSPRIRLLQPRLRPPAHQCHERNRLEFHHRHPFAMGGDHSPKNVGLLCRTHNSYLAVCDYGEEAMARHFVRKPRFAGV